MTYTAQLSRHEIELLVAALTQHIDYLARTGARVAEMKAVSNRIDELEAITC